MAGRKLQGILILLVLALSGWAQAEVFQWRDANGKLHFGDRPPEHAVADRIQTDSGPKREQLALVIPEQQFRLSQAAHERVTTLLPQILHIYRSLFRLDIRETVEVKLHLLDSKADFDAWLAKRTGRKESLPATGIYVVRTREVAVWNTGIEEDVVKTILHESSHVIMAQVSPRAPSWLQEGMAEYMEALAAHGDALEVAPLPLSQQRIRHWLDSGELITLRTYLGIPENEWRQMAHNANAIPYTVAWATVYFMLSSETGKSTLRRILHDMEKSDRWPTLADLDQRYPGGITRMDYEFFRWAQGAMAPHRYEKL